ncbi:hypothetical protein BE20_18205 [Sorangium cellulosum]|uniref:Uncharacterized protein n=1 Tax=Sorangium cellulosum TaxID=56 RepID=A0A150SCR9_SORCE|nr:hypothetical protein BE20_18205 [Sorangium cellulosum]KYF93978.1 hypothetical protein BE18_31960 [Sorangium cellulosum]
MQARLILEHGGHAITKRVELTEAPAVGSVVMAERERAVVSVEHDAARGETDVYLRKDALDLKMQTLPEAHLAYLELMKGDGWEIEDETVLRVELRHLIDRQDEDEPVDPN